MIMFKNVRLVSFNPPGISGPVDLAANSPSEGGPLAGCIVETGENLAGTYPGATVAGEGGYLSPGLVCSHTHLYSALARGMEVAIQPSKDFAQQLVNLWWRLDRAIDPAILESSALAGCADALAAGVTSLVDHHASPEAINGSLSIIRKACEETGLRGILCYETTDRNGMEQAGAGVAENIRFAREVDSGRARGARPLVECAIGAHAGFTVGDGTLEALGDAVRKTGRGLHVHLAEDKYDAVDSRARHGLDPVERFDRAGALNDKSIVGHGVWLSPSEVEIMNARGTFLAHNARSNMNNSVGYNALLASYANVVLGTDGMGADMLEEFKFAVFRQRESQGPWWPDNFLACLDRGNRILEKYFAADFKPGTRFGSLDAGSPADLVLWDYDPPTPLDAANIAGHLAFGMGSRSARTVVVNGEVRIKNRKALFDIERINAEARVQARRLWKNMEGR